jgi:hypothetical protein
MVNVVNESNVMINDEVSDNHADNGNSNNHNSSNNNNDEVVSSKRQRRAVQRPDYVQHDFGKICTMKPKKHQRHSNGNNDEYNHDKYNDNDDENIEDEFATTWICVECKEAECMIDPNATELLICDGICRRVFHYPCAGLLQLPDSTIPFICNDCTVQKHICTLCSNYGYDNEDVYKCSKRNCGLFYHESCLSMQNIDVEIIVVRDTSNRRDTGTSTFTEKGFASTKTPPNTLLDTLSTPYITEQRKFICPAHCCWTCTQIDLQEQEQEKQQLQNDKDITNCTTTAATKVTNSKTKKRKNTKRNGSFESKREKHLMVCTFHVAIPLFMRRLSIQLIASLFLYIYIYIYQLAMFGMSNIVSYNMYTSKCEIP